MDKHSSEADRWLQAGYQLFADGGAHMIRVSQLSRNTGLSPHKFTYFFRDRDQFLDCLLGEHERRVEIFRQALHTCTSYIPEVFQLLTNYSVELRFHRQLLLGKNNDTFHFLYERLTISPESPLYYLWAEYVEYSGNEEAGRHLYLMLINLWLLHLNPLDLSYEVMVQTAEHIHQQFKEFKDAWVNF